MILASVFSLLFKMNLNLVYSTCFLGLTVAYGIQVPDDLTAKLLLTVQLLYFCGCLETATVDGERKLISRAPYIIIVWVCLLMQLSDFTFKLGCSMGWWLLC